MRHWWWLCLLPALCWAEPLKLAVPGLSVVDVDAQKAAFLAEHLAQELSDEGAQVVSQQDLTVMLGLDRQRQLMGCAGGRCVTELTSALGVDCLVTGSVARVSGERFQLNLRMLDATTGQRLRTYTKRVVSFEAVLDEMSKAARAFVKAGNKRFGRSSSPQAPVSGPQVTKPGTETTPSGPIVETPSPSPDLEPSAPDTPIAPAPVVVYQRPPRQPVSPIRKWAWVPVAAGGVALGTGIFFFLGSDAKYQELTDGTVRSTREAAELRDSGKKQQSLARISLSAGTMLLITGTAMALFTSPDTEPVVSLGKGHVSVGIAGELP